MKRIDRVIAALKRRHAEERQRITKALRQLNRRGPVSVSRALNVAQEIILAGDRTLRKRDSDGNTERARCVTVGARVPRETAERYKAQAQKEDISMYRWSVNAFEVYYALGEVREHEYADDRTSVLYP